MSKFGTKFVTTQLHHLTSIALVNIHKEKRESLRLFMKRFSKVTLNIQNLCPDVAMHHMVTTLQPRPFVDSVCKKPVVNLDELRQRDAKYMQLEELREYKSQARIERR